MERTFCLALGSMWRWEKSRNKDTLIKYAKKLDISGIEITLSTKEELYSFKLSDKNRKWVRDLEYVSIHSPFKLIRNANDDKEIFVQLDLVSKLYDDLGAEMVLIHPTDIPSTDILNEYDFNVSTENMPPDKNITVTDIKNILKKYKNMKLCLDVSHAYLWSKTETEKLYNSLKNSISQVHFSGTYRRAGHQSLRIVTNEFLKSIECVKKINAPIVIEEDIEKKDIRYLRDELEFIKKMF